MARFIYPTHVLTPAPDQKPTGKHSDSAADRDTPTIVENFPKKAHQQGKSAGSGSDQYAIKSIDTGPKFFGNIALHSCASQNCAVAPEESTDSSVD